MATKVEVRIDKCTGESVQCAVAAGTDYMYGDGRYDFNIGTTGGTNQSLTITKHGGGNIKIKALDAALHYYIDSAKKPKSVRKGASFSLSSKENRVVIYEKPR